VGDRCPRCDRDDCGRWCDDRGSSTYRDPVDWRARALAAEREAERLRHGATIEGDHVCPDALRADRAEAWRARIEPMIEELRRALAACDPDRPRGGMTAPYHGPWAAVAHLPSFRRDARQLIAATEEPKP
jgi:hypothetical protein